MLDARGECAVVAVYHLDARRAPELAGSSKVGARWVGGEVDGDAPSLPPPPLPSHHQLFLIIDPTLRVVAPEAGGGHVGAADEGEDGAAGTVPAVDATAGERDEKEPPPCDDEHKVPPASAGGTATWSAFRVVQVLRPAQFLVDGRPLSAAFAAEGVRVEHFDA